MITVIDATAENPVASEAVNARKEAIAKLYAAITATLGERASGFAKLNAIDDNQARAAIASMHFACDSLSMAKPDFKTLEGAEVAATASQAEKDAARKVRANAQRAVEEFNHPIRGAASLVIAAQKARFPASAEKRKESMRRLVNGTVIVKTREELRYLAPNLKRKASTIHG